MLDTNIIIDAHDGVPAVLSRMLVHAGDLTTSTLCLVELSRGIHRRPALAQSRRQSLDLLLSGMSILPFERKAADAYEAIIARTGFVRSRDFDRMIGAHALSTGAVLVTNNIADFRDIDGLRLENWAAS
jgi:tRNA(fMet)-specific endonuclease VapC